MILLCYDGSPTAQRAISVAHDALGDTLATLLYVSQPPAEFLAPDWFGGLSPSVGPPIAELESLALKRAEGVAEQGRGLARSVGFVVDARAQFGGSVWRTILDVGDEIDAEDVPSCVGRSFLWLIGRLWETAVLARARGNARRGP